MNTYVSILSKTYYVYVLRYADKKVFLYVHITSIFTVSKVPNQLEKSTMLMSSWGIDALFTFRIIQAHDTWKVF